MSRLLLHIVTGLGVGGAETTLLRLVQSSPQKEWRHRVVSLTSGGALASAFTEVGAEVIEFNLKPDLSALRIIPSLMRLIRVDRPAVIQTWMYHANLLGGSAAWLAGVRALAWGLHHTNLDPKYNKRLTLAVARFGGGISRFVPDTIVCCSESTKDAHVRYGYETNRLRVIPNGYDIEGAAPDPDARFELRRELGITPDAEVIGMVGRFHPLKDHANFLTAAARFKAVRPGARFILCGEGLDDGNAELAELIDDAGLHREVILLGRRNDPIRVMNTFDISTLSSRGEGFPNVICEAMLCGIPCVVTDVGDSAHIVGNTGAVVPPGNPVALSDAWCRVLGAHLEERISMGQKARLRIVENYSIKTISAIYHNLWSDMADRYGN